MSSPVNIVTIENGESKIYYNRGLAQHMDAFAILGEENFRVFMDENYDDDDAGWRLLVNGGAEGGLLLDFDNKVLIWFGGEDLEGDRPYLDAYMLLLQQAWPEWDTRWANMGNYDIGLYLGLDESELREIVGAHRKVDRPLEDVVRSYPNERTGLITINGERGCFTRSTSCCFINDLLDFGERLASLYEPMADFAPATVDMRPNEYLACWVEWAADPTRKSRSPRFEKANPLAKPACGYAKSANMFPEYGIFIDPESKYLEYWNTCGYFGDPVVEGVFPDDWIVVDKGSDYTSHFASAGSSIELISCDPRAYFPVIEGWTQYLSRSESINALQLDHAEIHSHFASLYDGYMASEPNAPRHMRIELVQEASLSRPDDSDLPNPQPYDGPHFSVLDYASPKYAEAKIVGEAIEMRGADAFFDQVSAEDFSQDSQEIGTLLGFAELWAESTWDKSMPEMRNVEQEKAANSLEERDLIEVKRCSPDISDWEMAFYTIDGRLLPYTPYHDYDDVALSRWLDELHHGEKLLCQVKDVTCYGEDGVQADPDFCWRVYSCSVKVYKVAP